MGQIKPTRPSARRLVTTLNCYFHTFIPLFLNLISFYCCCFFFFSHHCTLSLSSVCPFLCPPFACLLSSQGRLFIWVKQTQWGNCQNKSLPISRRKQVNAPEKRIAIPPPPFFFNHAINQFPFTSFHSCQTMGLINPSGKAHYPFPSQRCL